MLDSEPSEQELLISKEQKETYIHQLQLNIDIGEMTPFFEGNITPEWQTVDDLPTEISQHQKDRFKEEIEKMETVRPRVLQGERKRRPQSLKELFVIISTLDDQGKIDDEINKALQELEDNSVKAELKEEILRIRKLSREEQLAEIEKLAEKFSDAKMEQFRSDGMQNIIKLFNPFRGNKLMKPLIIGLSFLTNPNEIESLRELLKDDYEKFLAEIRSGMDYLEEIKGIRNSTIYDIERSNRIAEIVQQLIAQSDEELKEYIKPEFDLRAEIVEIIETIEDWGTQPKN